MKKLKKIEGVAVFASIAVLGYLFFSDPIASLFTSNQENVTDQQLPDSGVETKDLTLGSGAAAVAGDTLTVHYLGTLPNGQVFDSSYDRGVPIAFTLGIGQVIKGWDEGVLGMRVGGKRVLKIAPDYGYGERATGAIPANSHLIFEVELLNVKRSE